MSSKVVHAAKANLIKQTTIVNGCLLWYTLKTLYLNPRQGIREDHNETIFDFNNYVQAAGRGGGSQMVIILTFFSNNPSLKPAEVYSFYSVKLFEANENKRKRGWGWPFLNVCANQRFMWPYVFSTRWKKILVTRKPWYGLVVMRGDSLPRGRGFNYCHRILDGHFFHIYCCKNCNDVCLKRPKINYKRGRWWPIFRRKKNY